MTEEYKKTIITRRISLFLWACALIIVGFSIGLIVGGGVQKVGGAFSEAPPAQIDFAPVWKVLRVIDERFVPAAVATTTASSTVSIENERVWGMIQGLASSLNDPYTFFLPPVENQQFADDMSGSFEGVGMEIAIRDQMLTVVSPLKNTPAEQAGLESGDKITHIDGMETKGLDIASAVRHIRGPRNTEVILTVVREGWSEPHTIPVTRAVIDIPTITTKHERASSPLLNEEATATKSDVFVIELMNFSAQSSSLFRNALREFVESGLPYLIVDVRGNPGGYLEAAVEMASWFIPAGKIIVEEDYAGHANNIVHRSRGYDIFNNTAKVVVLIDKGSASASEIFAHALRYWGKATLLGESTFGKGSVQELVDITPDTALKITVARWLGPDGAQIPHSGVVPDIEVKISSDDKKAKKDPQMERAIEFLVQ